MYPDPKRVKDNRVIVRLDDYEHGLLVALANYKGVPLATLLREIVMSEAGDILDQQPQTHTQTTD